MAVKQDGASSDRSLRNHLAVLEDAHRRAVVTVLAEEDNSVSLSLLAEWVAADARNESLDDLDRSELKRLKVELHHNHLPKLDEAGVLEYSADDHLVAPTDGTTAARRTAEALNDV